MLRVLSVVVSSEYNYLINPEHPDFEQLRVEAPRALHLDPRLLKRCLVCNNRNWLCNPSHRYVLNAITGRPSAERHQGTVSLGTFILTVQEVARGAARAGYSWFVDADLRLPGAGAKNYKINGTGAGAHASCWMTWHPRGSQSSK